MNKREIREELRILIDDLVEPYGWSDKLLDTYLERAQRQFCRDTGFFVDFHSYSVTTTPGVSAYEFDPDHRVIELLEVWNTATGLRIDQFGEDDRPDFIPTLQVQQTTPYMWQADQDLGYLTFYPTPGEAVTFNLRVWRMAKTPWAKMKETEYPEGILQEYEAALMEWAASRAYMVHDRERANMPKATEHMNEYKKYKTMARRAFLAMRSTHPHVAPGVLYAFR